MGSNKNRLEGVVNPVDGRCVDSVLWQHVKFKFKTTRQHAVFMLQRYHQTELPKMHEAQSMVADHGRGRAANGGRWFELEYLDHDGCLVGSPPYVGVLELRQISGLVEAETRL